jgi:DHA1 family multidrug resistance protein-like MFS transporter
MQIMIAFSTNLAMLYTARILGSLLSSFLVPVVNAYISDITTEEKRTRAIAWAGTAASAGVIIGPGISSLLIINNLHFRWQSGHWMIDRFSVPFLALAILGVITLLVSLVVLKRAKRTPATARQKLTFRIFPKGKWKSMGELLILSLIIQFAITLFESVFILYGKGVRDYSASFIGIGLLVCGLVMAILQPVIAKWGPLIFRNIKKQILYGFLIAGTVLMLFVLDQATWYLITAIGLFGLGTSLVIPNLITLISLQGNKSSGWALGMQSSFSGIGQIVGPLLGTAIYTLNRSAPFYVAGGLLVLVAFIQFNKNKILKK